MGCEVQRRLGEGVTLGAEVFHETARQEGRSGDTRFNIGLVLDLGRLHHILLSAGHAIGADAAQGYIAYQLALGPEPAPATIALVLPAR